MLDLYLCTLCARVSVFGIRLVPPYTFWCLLYSRQEKKRRCIGDHTVFYDLNMLSETDGSPFKNFVTLVLSVVQLLFFFLNNFNILFQR